MASSSKVNTSWKSFWTPGTNTSGLLALSSSKTSEGSAKGIFPTDMTPKRNCSFLMSLFVGGILRGKVIGC